jgi:hypothetical protein
MIKLGNGSVLMEMRNFILHRDILSVEVTIDKKEYIIGVQTRKALW